MNAISYLVFFAWIPLIFVIFSKLPVRRATVVALIPAWLFLPQATIDLPGLPDYKRTTATSIGILLALMTYAPDRLRSIQLRWFDLPMLVWCICPALSSLANDLGAYDAASSLLEQLVTWGFPYLVGRACLGDAEGLRELSIGMIVGGLSYIPLALIEMRMSPQLHTWVYGFAASSFANVQRYGGYRPVVFMKDGLELGMYMVAASMAGYWLWASGALGRIRGIPFNLLLAALVVTTVLCKSTGALVLMVVGLIVLETGRRLGTRLPALGLVLLAPLYCGARSTGLWDGRALVTASSDSAGADRAQSLEFRLDNEDMLIKKAMERPLLGWAGWGRARVYADDGKDLTITDGLWIIAFGNQGVLGLSSLSLVFLLPLTWFALRFPPRKWITSGLAPAAVLGVILAIYMVDNLSNGMVNLIYITASGALLGSMSALDAVGESHAVDPSYRRALETDATAETVVGTEASSVLWEAIRAWKFALEPIDDSEIPPERDGERAHGYAMMGRHLTQSGQHREALEAKNRALELRHGLMARNPDDHEAHQHYADALNDLAWAIATSPDPTMHRPDEVIALAGRAIRISPANPSYHNTLAACFCRAKDWPAAILALGRSYTLSRGGSRFDHLLMATALAGRGDLETARESFRLAERAADARTAGSPDWQVLRAQAVALLAAGGGPTAALPFLPDAPAERADLPDP